MHGQVKVCVHGQVKGLCAWSGKGVVCMIR